MSPVGEGVSLDIPSFTFRVSSEDVQRYRRALGVGGERLPFGLALRALLSEEVSAALKDVAQGRHPIHIAQEFRAEAPFLAEVAYVCDVRVKSVGHDRLRVEQRLSEPSGRLCLEIGCDIALVAP